MSDTPRTDALARNLYTAAAKLNPKPGDSLDFAPPAEFVRADFARQLERELKGLWVPCDKRLPVGVEKPLLLYGDHAMLIMGIFNTPDSVFMAWDDEYEEWRTFDTRVTHWMEIPNTPDGKSGFAPGVAADDRASR